MKIELIKIIKVNITAGVFWIVLDMLLYYHHHHHFSFGELEIAMRPIVVTLGTSMIIVYLKNRKN